MRKGFARAAALDRVDGLRSPFTRGRRLEGNLDVHQLPMISKTELRKANGSMLFIVGYSEVGGGDVVGP